MGVNPAAIITRPILFCLEDNLNLKIFCHIHPMGSKELRDRRHRIKQPQEERRDMFQQE